MKNILYKSTRGAEENITASAAVLKGLASDGGLFVPQEIPALDKSLEELSHMNYQEVAYEVMKLFLSDYTEEELKYCISHAYDDKFDTPEIAPLAKAGGAYYLELFHGATIAFKDMALSILPYLMTTAAKKNHAENDIVILTATSGDTGKAALAGFCGCTPYQNYCLLSQGRRQPDSEKTDGDPERGQYAGGRRERQFR